MSEAKLKFSGSFTLEDTESKSKYSIPSQVLFQDDHHVIVIYGYKTVVQPPWIAAIITGIITHFGLDHNTTVAIATDGSILKSGEAEAPNTKVYPIEFRWVRGSAIVKDIEEYKDDSTEAT